MADTLITGTTLVENTSRSVGDVPVGGIVEMDETFNTIPDGFVACDGSTVSDPLSSYNGSAVPNFNTNQWTCTGTNFTAKQPDVDDVHYAENDDGQIETDGAGITTLAPVFLPHNAVVTGAIVYGNSSTENFNLIRSTLTDSTATTMAQANINTEDSTISNATIDNTLYGYFILTDAMDANDTIYGARITYTTRKKFIIRIK